MPYLIYIFFGLAPSIVWLLFYLRKDVHPEPKRKVLKVFFFGGLITIPALFVEEASQAFFQAIQISKLKIFPVFPLGQVIYTLLGIALWEELLKYLVVQGVILSDPEFDEPVDSMLYMIISALGFAAIENIILFFRLKSSLLLEAFILSSFRFWGATFLHALCSGAIGYFLALSFFRLKDREELLILGLGISTLLHGFYNLSIMEIEGIEKFILPIIILGGLALFISWGFKRLRAHGAYNT